jgi:hypothetical protein
MGQDVHYAVFSSYLLPCQVIVQPGCADVLDVALLFSDITTFYFSVQVD